MSMHGINGTHDPGEIKWGEEADMKKKAKSTEKPVKVELKSVRGGVKIKTGIRAGTVKL